MIDNFNYKSGKFQNRLGNKRGKILYSVYHFPSISPRLNIDAIYILKPTASFGGGGEGGGSVKFSLAV